MDRFRSPDTIMLEQKSKTGAGSGMGRVAALMFAKEGAKIGAIDIDENAARETVRLIEAEGGNAVPFVADTLRR